jgi:hypothetical protein
MATNPLKVLMAHQERMGDEAGLGWEAGARRAGTGDPGGGARGAGGALRVRPKLTSLPAGLALPHRPSYRGARVGQGSTTWFLGALQPACPAFS